MLPIFLFFCSLYSKLCFSKNCTQFQFKNSSLRLYSTGSFLPSSIFLYITSHFSVFPHNALTSHVNLYLSYCPTMKYRNKEGCKQLLIDTMEHIFLKLKMRPAVIPCLPILIN